MAATTCDLQRLSVLAYANGFTLWHYHAPEGPNPYSDIALPGYFSAACHLLRVGDVIYCRTDTRVHVDRPAKTRVRQLYVAANTGTRLDIVVF